MKQQAIGVLSTFSQTRVGLITGYDPATYRAKVAIQPDNIITGWIPIMTSWGGSGWGSYEGPNINDLVMCHFQEGDLSSGFVGGHAYNLIDLPINPAPPSGEKWTIHKTGTLLKFKNDGSISISTFDANGNPTNINIVSNVVITGNLTVSGDVLDTSGTNTNTVKDMRTIFNAHIHPTPAGNSSAPTTSM